MTGKAKRTRAPARIKVTTPAPAGSEAAITLALEEGGRYVDSNRGRIIVGRFIHEIPRVEVAAAMRDRVFEDIVNVVDHQEGGAA